MFGVLLRRALCSCTRMPHVRATSSRSGVPRTYTLTYWSMFMYCTTHWVYTALIFVSSEWTSYFLRTVGSTVSMIHPFRSSKGIIGNELFGKFKNNKRMGNNNKSILLQEWTKSTITFYADFYFSQLIFNHHVSSAYFYYANL